MLEVEMSGKGDGVSVEGKTKWLMRKSDGTACEGGIMTDQSRTPRVDAAVSTVTVPFEREEKILVTEAVPADFARKLELELAESQAEARRLLDRVVGLIDEREKAEARCRELEAALERISHAKADRLDHAIDIGIIDRAVNIAKAALLAAAKELRK